MSDPAQTPSTPAASTTPAAQNVLQQIETSLSAEWQGAANFLSEAEAFFGNFLTKVAAGGEILISEIESVGQYVAGHLTAITAGIGVLGAAVNSVAPGNVTAQKVIDDLNLGAADVAALSNSLTSGSTVGDDSVVASAVTAIGAVKQLSQLSASAGKLLTDLTNNSPTATQVVSPATPSSAG
jgi:hypothetical protein